MGFVKCMTYCQSKLLLILTEYDCFFPSEKLGQFWNFACFYILEEDVCLEFLAFPKSSNCLLLVFIFNFSLTA